jgi:hypothetical protein
MERPHLQTKTAMRPSRFLLGAIVGFIGVAGAAVFQSLPDAPAAALVCMAVLGLAANRWLKGQPKGIELHADSLTTWRKNGGAEHWRVEGCARMGSFALSLSLTSSDKKKTLLIDADSVHPDLFRQLTVNARRAAQAYL